MKQIVFLLFLSMTPLLQARLQVVATLPDYAAIAREVGGDDVEVHCLARATEDPHFVDPKPSFTRLLNRADVLIESGAELEVGWLPPLVDVARNKKIVPGGKGRLAASTGIHLLDKPTGPIDRSQGDVHASGNPHFTLDPSLGLVLAQHVAHLFSTIDAEHAVNYAARLAAFEKIMKEKIVRWEDSLESLRGSKILTYHKTFDYFARRFGLEVAGVLEPRPGIEPSPSYLNGLIQRYKNSSIRAVVVEPNRSRKMAEFVASKIGAEVVVLPSMVENHEKPGAYAAHFDRMTEALIAKTKK